jgi:hypothetical protein
MTDKTKKKSRRLGPFQLGRRCKHAAVELGRIHEARNVETGASALVVMPGPQRNGMPRRSWKVRASFQASLPFFSLEVEEAPASGKVADLANLLVMLLAGLDAVENNAHVRAHLTREPVRWWMRRPALMGLGAVVLAALVLGGGYWWGSATRSMGTPTPSLPAASTGERADTRSPFSFSFLIDGDEQARTGISYPLPDKPASNQAKPPCRTGRDEIAINGGCWVALERKPPCHEEQAEYQGKCYLPVSVRTRLPQSVSP